MTCLKTSVSFTEKTQKELVRLNEILQQQDKKILSTSEALRFGMDVVSKIPREELGEKLTAFRVQELNL